MAVALLALLALAPSLVHAAGLRYATSSNRIYVEGGQKVSLTDIKAALPHAPLDRVDAERHIWLLRANLLLTNGSTLTLHGSSLGGDVDELRLKSENTSATDRFVSISADHGTLDIQSTRILSWNSAANGPDTEYAKHGRAWIRVRSRQGADGRALESRMDIVDSEVSHLGYKAAEAYGLVWKVIGSGAGLYDKVQVRGNIINSRIHHNYFGIYTYGHQDGIWRDNEVAHNVQYGFDPHDDSDNLLIENNNVHHNGNHGIIASQRCDHVIIRDNRSWANTGNGIMLHRSSNDARVEGNETYDNTDSGIAIFASDRNIIRGNLIRGNGRAGMRFSLGSADNVVENNQVVENPRYGVWFYKGNDAPNSGDDGRPKRNVFRSNLIKNNGAEGIKLSDGDRNRFQWNVFENNASRFLFYRARNNELSGNQLPVDLELTVEGTPDHPSSLQLSSQPVANLKLNTLGSALFTDSAGAVFDSDAGLYTVATRDGSTLHATFGNTRGRTTVLTRDLQVVPRMSTVEVRPLVWDATGDRRKEWNAKSNSAGQPIDYAVGDLKAGETYRVREGSREVGTFVADESGRIRFSVAPDTTALLHYSVQPGGLLDGIIGLLPLRITIK